MIATSRAELRILRGQRVATLSHTDVYMQGDRYGTVVAVGHKYVHVRMDRSGSIRSFVITKTDGEKRRVSGLKRVADL